MDLPANVPDLEMAVGTASTGRCPGLDGLNYEFYNAVFMCVGLAMADGLNSMLEEASCLPPSARGCCPRSRVFFWPAS